MLEATSDWSMNIDNGLINGVVFIDLKKAFDTTMGIDQMKSKPGLNLILLTELKSAVLTTNCQILPR